MVFPVFRCSSCGYFNTEKARVDTHIQRSHEDQDDAAAEAWEGSLSPPENTKNYTMFTVYTCCNAVASMPSRLKRHGCDKVPEMLEAFATIKPVEETHEGIIVGSGFDVEDTEGLDLRADYLCQTPEVLTLCFADATPIRTATTIFRRLWGDHAPARFRCFRRIRNALYEYKGDKIVRHGASMHERDIMVVNVIEAVTEMANAVAGRCPDYAERARYFVQRLNGSLPLRTVDIIEHNDSYLEHYKNYPNQVRFAELVRTSFNDMLKRLV